ncbi:MAG: hypothetical protein EOM91_24770 [Sphingobacteriia bacterium]|nr:hypothetical protein [Sphingobacteriia bacterium]
MIDRLYILAMIALICCGTLGLLWMSRAMAEPVPAYRGCTLAWDYSAEDQALIGGFGVFVGDRRAGTVAPDARTFPCDSLGLTIGETALIKVRAWGIGGGHSEWATLEATYLEPPVVTPPARIRLEWIIETEIQP